MLRHPIRISLIQRTRSEAFSSSIAQHNQNGIGKVRKYIVRLAYTSLGIGVAYDAFNEFQTTGSVNRFVRSLRIAVTNSFDYSYHLYGLTEESVGYDEVMSFGVMDCKQCIIVSFLLHCSYLKKSI